MVAGIVARLLELPRAVVLAEDETHLNLLPHVRASWTLRGAYTVDIVPQLSASAGRSLTRSEWARYVPRGPAYESVCP